MKILFFIFLFTLTLPLNAQITKKNWMVGGDVTFSYSSSKPESIVDSNTFRFSMSPNVGYFFWDKLALGMGVNYIMARSKSDTGSSNFDSFLVSPFARYYFLNSKKLANPFIGGSYRFSIINENNSKEFLAKGGVAIFLNNSVAFEISLNYLNSISNNAYIGSHTILLGFGIQVHLQKP